MDGKAAASNLEKCLKDFPKSARRAEMLLNLGKAYAFDDQKDKAKKAVNTVIAEFPGSSAAAQASELLKAY